MFAVTDFIEENLFIPPDVQVRIFRTIMIIVVTSILYSLVKRLMRRTIKDLTIYYKTKKTVLYVLVVIAFVLVSRAWFDGVQSFVTLVGLFSAALAIVMKDVILNIAGWMFIVVKNPFKVGNRVEVDGVSGDVIDIQLLNFQILEIGNWIYGDKYSGRVVSIPNAVVFDQHISNYNKETPYIWSEFKVSVFYDSNWEKAKEILQQAAEDATAELIPKAEERLRHAPKSYNLFRNGLDPKVYTRINDETADVTFVVRYITHYESRRGTAQKIYEQALREFRKHGDIQLGVPFQIVQFDEGDSYEVRQRKKNYGE